MAKTGTPAMGGILIVGWVLIISIVVNVVRWLNQLEFVESALIPLSVMVAYSILGGFDDYQGFRQRPGEGMLARVKIWFQLGIALAAALGIYFLVNNGRGLVAVPTVPVLIDVGLLYIPIAVIVISGTANAVNLTDGLDGLAGAIAAVCFMAYAGIAFMFDQQFLVTFCMIVVGACFAFLWFNAKPAQMFMGDVGSQALGGALGVVALMTNQWLILPIIAIVPVATTLSTVLQVLYFKATGGKRLFKMAPLHHHFELIGWSETQIVQRWWLLSILAAMVGIALALV
jgi:phospho-N-acetylmuramoyl-pentapeptide-transferase